MAITFANLTADADADGGSSSTTASVSPSANKLQLLSVATRKNETIDPVAPTVTGCGLTWDQVATILFDTTSTSRKRLTLFRALGPSPTAGALTIDFGGVTQTHVVWSLDEVSGASTAGTNGSGAIVQSATNKDETSVVTGLTVTLGAFSDVANATYGVFADDLRAGAATVGSGFTALADHGNDFANIFTEAKSSNDTTVDYSGMDVGGLTGGIAVEIAAAGTQPTIDSDPGSQTKHVGETATFTCTASSHGGTGLSYQWEENNGAGWSNVGTNSSSYTTGTLTRLMNGYQYRVTVTDSAGSDTSTVATLTVQEGIHYWSIG